MTTNVTAPSRSAPLDTPIDHRSLLNVTSWVLIITTFLVVFTRCGTKWAVSRSFGLDDGLITLSMLLAVFTTVALTIGVSNGLGLLDWEQDSNRQADKLQKAVYSFNILFVISQSLAKVSVAVFIRTITPDSVHRSLASFICVGIGVWTGTAVFGLIFQCRTPEVWRFLHNTCINRLSFYTYIEIGNIALDLCLVMLPAVIAWHLRVKLSSKLIIVGCFVARVIVIAATLVQLVILYKQNEKGEPFLSWSFIISTEIILCLGITTACVPYLKPFLQSLNSGMIGSDDLRRRGGNSTIYKYASKTKKYSRKKISDLFSTYTDNSGLDSGNVDPPFPLNLRGIALQSDGSQGSDRNETFVTANRDGVCLDWEDDSQSSRGNFICQTRGFAVRTEHVA